jgi:hypothetical protein
VRRALAVFALLLAASAWTQAPPPATPAEPQILKPDWDPAVYSVGSLAGLTVRLPVPASAFYMEGDLSEGADWGPRATIVRIIQEPPASFPGTLVLRLRIQVFAVGDVTLPPLNLVLRTQSSSSQFLLAPPPLHVAALLPPGDQPKPPAAPPLPLPAPFPLGWILLAVAAAALASLGAVFLLRRRRSRRKAPPAQPNLKETDPDRWAREEADRILRSRSGPRERYSALSGLLREYLEIKLHDPFLEWTTSEVHEGCGRHEVLHGPPTTDLLGVLSLCDWVQFARHEPSEEEERQVALRVHSILSAVSRPPLQEKAS